MVVYVPGLGPASKRSWSWTGQQKKVSTVPKLSGNYVNCLDYLIFRYVTSVSFEQSLNWFHYQVLQLGFSADVDTKECSAGSVVLMQPTTVF